MEPFLRPASESDANLLLQMMEEYYRFDGHAFDRPKASSALLNFLRDPSFGRAWLICEQQIPVGYVVLTFGYSLEFLGRDAFLDEFYLRESHRGLGWGREALEYVEEQARNLEIRSIHLEVVQENTAAKEFYRHRGYVAHRHSLMSKWIERRFPKPTSSSP
ncbi:MAG: GNAT family N-acetyltransferase [Acidobacteria bacterium]|nr:MAG: GNAT family N-acetyltransferase [Acidobacteriota bacterium]